MRLPIAFTTEEGGAWVPWSIRFKYNKPPTGIVAHSIMFDDGSVFDMVNGWREHKICPECKGTGKAD